MRTTQDGEWENVLSRKEKIACEVWTKQEILSGYLNGVVQREMKSLAGEPVIAKLPGRQRDLIMNVRHMSRLHPEGISLKRLAGNLGITSPTVSVMVESLVEQGLLVRATSGKDRRIRLIRLSPRSERLFQAGDKIISRELLRLVAELPEGFLEELRGNLEKVEAQVPEL